MPTTAFNTSTYYVLNEHLPELQQKWQGLQEQAQHSAFTSWFWINQWLAQKDLSGQNCLCIEVTYNQTTVGLALFGIKTQKVLGCINICQFFLHKSGNKKEDQIWIEHNKFLCHNNYQAQVTQQICQQLSQIRPLHDIKIGLSSPRFNDSLNILGFKRRTELTSTGYLANLAGMDNLDDYLASLSKNTRSHIKRAFKLLNQQSPIHLELATSTDEKIQTLANIAELHRRKWRTTVYGSGFDNPIFYDFHQNLITQDQDNQHCRLYTLYQNHKALGYVYLFTHQDTWSFYLSALQFNSDNRIKVGLVMHSLVIEQAILHGVKVYDFLAGEAQYKASLSNALPYAQNIYVYYRQTPILKLREFLRKWKRKLLGKMFSNLWMKLHD
ncbi:GNAT family N-acetyltransferase [Paraglaciecola aestuariivivens]